MTSNSATADGTSEDEDIHHHRHPGARYNSNLASPPSQQSEAQHQQASATSLATAAAAAAVATACSVNHSVVPDLMRVYESMTQSSTPAFGGQQQRALHSLYHDHDSTSSNLFYQKAPPQQAWSTYDTAPTTNITIPHPFPLPQEQEHSRSSRSESGDVGIPASTAASGRPIRKKRSIASTNDDNNGNSNSGYASSTGSSTRGATKTRQKGGSKTSNTIEDSSSSVKGKPKDDKNDGRWSKRFTWPDDLHRDFVSAIFDVGLKHSSPSTVMEQMPPHEQITTERIKSHLQKYRLHRQKAKKEFMTSYEATVQQLHAEGLDGVEALAGGQVAGHLTFATLTQPDPEPMDDSDSNAAQDEGGDASPGGREAATRRGAALPAQQQAEEVPQHDVFILPRLTEAEKQSPIGTSLGYLMGLFFSLKQQLELQRQEESATSAAAAAQTRMQDHQEQQSQREQDQQHPAGAVFDSFVSEQHPQQPSSKVSAASAGPIIPAIVPSSSTRSNLEENSMMKREMQNQMAFQNKMRALKQQELNKYNKAASVAHAANNAGEKVPALKDGVAQAAELQRKQQQPQQEYQGAGETGGADPAGRDRTQSMSLGDEDDFWNTTVVDDELFDFLMNN